METNVAAAEDQLPPPGNCLLSRSSRTLNPAPAVLTSYARHTRASGPRAGKGQPEPAARGGPRGGPAPAIPADLAGHPAERDHSGRLRDPVRPDGAGPEHGERRHGGARRVLVLGGGCLPPLQVRPTASGRGPAAAARARAAGQPTPLAAAQVTPQASPTPTAAPSKSATLAPPSSAPAPAAPTSAAPTPKPTVSSASHGGG